MLVTEFGSSTSPQDLDKLGNITQEQDSHVTGSTFWVWKEGDGGWSMWSGAADTPGMHLQPRRKQILIRARPDAVTGQLLTLNYDTFARRLRFTAAYSAPVGANAEPGSLLLPPPPTLVYVPSAVASKSVFLFFRRESAREH